MAFLYNITHLLRLASTDKLNLARLAYLLARLKPSSFDKEKAHSTTHSPRRCTAGQPFRKSAASSSLPSTYMST